MDTIRTHAEILGHKTASAWHGFMAGVHGLIGQALTLIVIAVDWTAPLEETCSCCSCGKAPAKFMVWGATNLDTGDAPDWSLCEACSDDAGDFMRSLTWKLHREDTCGGYTLGYVRGHHIDPSSDFQLQAAAVGWDRMWHVPVTVDGRIVFTARSKARCAAEVEAAAFIRDERALAAAA